MSNAGVAKQIMENGKPKYGLGCMQVGTDKKGSPIYKAVNGSLWNLYYAFSEEPYETFIPDGYVPIYKPSIDTWQYTKAGGPEDPYKQLGFIQDNGIEF